MPHKKYWNIHYFPTNLSDSNFARLLLLIVPGSLNNDFPQKGVIKKYVLNYESSSLRDHQESHEECSFDSTLI